VLHFYNANISYIDSRIRFGKLEYFTTKFEVQINSHPYLRKIISKHKTILQPGEQAYLSVDYKLLPVDRSFSFYAEIDCAVHAVVDAKSPCVVPVVNLTPEKVTISRKAKVGYIREIIDSGYFASNWKEGLKAMAVAAAAVAATVVGSGEPIKSADVTPRPCTEFDLTPVIKHVATESDPTVSLSETAAGPTAVVDSSKGAEFSVSDQVYAMIQDSGIHEHVLALDETQVPELMPEKPKIPEAYNSIGIRKPENLPEEISVEEVRVYGKSKSFVSKVKKLCGAYPKLWIDEGPIKMPEEEWMKVPLVDGWQNHKLASRSYLLSKKDR
jgi:hypothetical protein